jgi:hypothetical protein
MNDEETLREAFVSIEVNADYSEAALTMRDGSRLCFCHRIDERTARAIGAAAGETESGLAGQILARIGRFRLNGKHLDIAFADGSRWEMRFPGRV